MTAPPLSVTTRGELDALLAPARRAARVALVPTMGALHEGHARLLRVARERVGGGPVVASIFVNPLQFAPGEDLDRYPRTLEEDLKVCEREGVDVLFVPPVEEIYPDGDPQVVIDPGRLGGVLEGLVRPGHFRGVLTVVAKLLGIVRPDVAVFGEKDYQQLVLVRRMVADLSLGIDIVGAPTEREPDGLALSSRNRYLNTEARMAAAVLSRALRAARDAAPAGYAASISAARTEVRTTSNVDLDYLVITDPELGDLPEQVPGGTPARILIAARVGTTRLIDNMELILGNPGGP
jgi:pantoate--beta-alanine ligase